MTKTLSKQLYFLGELEKLKTVYRQNGIVKEDRKENSAEHSWHSAVFALMLTDHAPGLKIDLLRVLKMLLIHDIGEIITGDVCVFEDEQRKSVQKIEAQEVQKLLNHLPASQAEEYFFIWQEFEAGTTDDARFAKVIDAFQPIVNHLHTSPEDTNPFGITKQMVLEKKAFIQELSPALWDAVLELVDQSAARGLYHVNDTDRDH